MERTIALEHTDATCAIMRKAFPGYAGRKYSVRITDVPQGPFRSYWSEGSIDYWAIVRLSDGAVLPIPENGSPFIPECQTPDLPQPGYAVVQHCKFCGNDLGLRLIIHPDNAAPLLPATSDELTHAELICLTATRSLKSSYNGISDYRLHEAVTETGIKASEFRAARESLKVKGLLDSRGAITVKGRNATGGKSLHDLRPEGYSRFAPGSYDRERELLNS